MVPSRRSPATYRRSLDYLLDELQHSVHRLLGGNDNAPRTLNELYLALLQGARHLGQRHRAEGEAGHVGLAALCVGHRSAEFSLERGLGHDVEARIADHDGLAA